MTKTFQSHLDGQSDLEIKTLQDSVLEYLIRRIIIGELRPRQKLEENELSSRLNISRSSLREALQVLRQIQLVTYIPRKGIFVTDLSAEDAKRLYAVREMIECYSIDLLKAEGIKELKSLRSFLESIKRLPAPPADELDEFYDYFIKFISFHTKLVECTKNNWLIRFQEWISHHLARYQFIFKLYIPEARMRSINDHLEILDLIHAGKYDKARELMKEHIRYGSKMLLEKIPQ